MKQNAPLGFLIIIIVDAKADGAYSRVHDKARGTRKIDLPDFCVQDGFLVGALGNSLQGLEQVALEAEVKFLAQGKYISPAPSHKIE